MKYDYLVVGAGLFGAVFAREMKKKGKRCQVIDKRNHIAGNIYTEEIKGIQVHRYGAHIFHTSDRNIWNYVNELAEFNNYVNSPLAVYQDELYNLPFNMNTFAKMWNIRTPREAAERIQLQIARLGITEPANLEEQALSLVGTDIYEKLVKGYTEKQWGRDCRELPAFIIQRLPVRFTYDNNYFKDPYQGIPKGGYTAMTAKLLEGIEVRLETAFEDYVRRDEKNDTYVPNDGQHTFEKVLYTGMIDAFFNYCEGALEYRALDFETELLEGEENYQGNAVGNYTERE
ncbi:MAG: NAD(P)-binding protein, partial [Lachnospiraceae bacterium]|nr:NAD(P)-binding protein [Lachnospiraceae bacterium]